MNLNAVLKLLVTSSIVSIAVSAKAATIVVNYTDAFSNNASLILNATLVGGGLYDVTQVNGTFDGSPITAGPVDNNPFFGHPADQFALSPLDVPTGYNNGFVFYTSTTHVELRTYNLSATVQGYATDITDANNSLLGSGQATITSVSTSPEPGSWLLLGCGLIGLAMFGRITRAKKHSFR